MKIRESWPAVLRGPIVHLEFPSLQAICGSMVRLQEFYESPLPGIKGNVFSLDQYVEANKLANGGKYDYDWTGYNIPGVVVREFFARFEALSDAEREIQKAIPASGEFYLIATITDDPDEDIVAHEVCHAFFYLSADYRTAMTRLVEKFVAENPDTSAALHAWLIKRGYDESVVVDEMQAYLATTPRDWWVEPEQGMSPEMAMSVWQCGHLFRAMVRS